MSLKFAVCYKLLLERDPGSANGQTAPLRRQRLTRHMVQ